jgi:hypothetical protein
VVDFFLWRAGSASAWSGQKYQHLNFIARAPMIDTAWIQSPQPPSRFPMSAPEKPAISAIVSPRSLDDFFVGFTPRETRYVVSEGDPQSEISELMLFPLWVNNGLYRQPCHTSAYPPEADVNDAKAEVAVQCLLSGVKRTLFVRSCQDRS